jgi:hypothetical protein
MSALTRWIAVLVGAGMVAGGSYVAAVGAVGFAFACDRGDDPGALIQLGDGVACSSTRADERALVVWVFGCLIVAVAPVVVSFLASGAVSGWLPIGLGVMTAPLVSYAWVLPPLALPALGTVVFVAVRARRTGPAVDAAPWREIVLAGSGAGGPPAACTEEGLSGGPGGGAHRIGGPALGPPPAAVAVGDRTRIPAELDDASRRPAGTFLGMTLLLAGVAIAWRNTATWQGGCRPSDGPGALLVGIDFACAHSGAERALRLAILGLALVALAAPAASAVAYSTLWRWEPLALAVPCVALALVGGVMAPGPAKLLVVLLLLVPLMTVAVTLAARLQIGGGERA